MPPQAPFSARPITHADPSAPLAPSRFDPPPGSGGPQPYAQGDGT